MAGTTSVSIKVALAVAVVAVLYFSALKSREALGADNLSRTEGISWQDCLDGGTGSISFASKQVVKVYAYNIRVSYVEKARQRASQMALDKGISDGLAINAAREKATKLGKEAAKVASRNHKRITGPVIAGAWDFFEVLYFAGTFVEAVVKGAGSFAGTYAGGVAGEQWLSWASSRLGYLVGSHLGSFLGGEVGLLIYDVFNGARLLAMPVGDFLSGTPAEEEATASSITDSDSSSGRTMPAADDVPLFDSGTSSDYVEYVEYQ